MKQAEKAEMRARARQDYLEGMSYRQIAAKYNVGIGSVSRWAEKDKWDPIDRNRNGTPKRNAGTERGTEGAAPLSPCGAALPDAGRAECDAEDTACSTEDPVDYDLLRETALLVLQKIRQRLEAEKPLEPRDIKSLTGALLDLKNQLNALSPRELREQALRLQALRKQAEDESKPTEPVVVKFVNREWDDAGA